MSGIFLYGTLRHGPLLRLVLGRDVEPQDLTGATLRDYNVFAAKDQPFPLIQSASGESVTGLLLRRPDAADIARLEFFEGGFGYDLRPVTVCLDGGADISAQVFLPRPGLWQAGARWSLERWVREWAPISLEAAREVMGHFGKLSAAQVASRFPGIRLRAAARLAAKARPADPDHDLARDVVVHAHHHPYSNFFAAEEMDLQYRRYDGSLSPILNRGAQIQGQTAVVLPYDPVADAVLLIEQFRAPVFMIGDPSPWIREPVSGLIDPGETPQAAAHRETLEEAGLHLSALENVGAVYSSTGSTSEFVHMFIGLGDFTTRQIGGGLADEGEDIRARILSFGELMQNVDDCGLRDMPLVTCALWLARHRDRLRKAG